MWLDRLSGQSTPSQSQPLTNKSISNPPPPKRTSSYRSISSGNKPVYPSSLSRLNDSTSSLSSERRLQDSLNGPEPLEVLEKLLASREKVPSSPLYNLGRENGNTAIVNRIELEEEIEFDGLSLRELAISRTEELQEEYEYRSQTIEDYQRDKAKFEDLHRSIRACDDVLNSVENNLTSFQNDLAIVSAEIETLQAKSTALGIRLNSRKIVESGLGPIVEEISLSPVIVRKIIDGPIDESWVKALAVVEKRAAVMSSQSKEFQHIKGISDLKPLLDNLVNKALERIRDFLVAQIKSLRSPNINAQIIQRQQIIRYGDLFAFLYKHHPQLAEDICLAYMNTMRWYFLNQFTRYQKALEKLKLHVSDKHDVLGSDDGSRKTTLLSGSKVSGPSRDAFNLGRRIDLLKSTNQTALSSFLAEEDKSTHYLEVPFRNFNLALVDNASAEYSFLTSFFSPSLSFAAISRHFNYIFEPTFILGQNLTKSLVSETLDSFGLLICVRLNQHFAFELQRRKIPAVDGYVNGTNMLLCPRFQIVMTQHCDSVRNSTNAISVRKQSASEQAKQSVAPHFLTQRFGQFLQGILTLSTEAADDEPVNTSLARLRSEIEAFLIKLSKNIGDTRKRERFLFNNYSLVLTIIGDLEGKLALEQEEHFAALKKEFENSS